MTPERLKQLLAAPVCEWCQKPIPLSGPVLVDLERWATYCGERCRNAENASTKEWTTDEILAREG